ncbi:Hypothetical predicted protein, partial [Marmota monax]
MPAHAKRVAARRGVGARAPAPRAANWAPPHPSRGRAAPPPRRQSGREIQTARVRKTARGRCDLAGPRRADP